MYDDRIRLAEYRAIYGFDGLKRYGLGRVPSIHIIVKNGHVTWRGGFGSRQEHGRDSKLNVPGVFGVRDDLSVSGSPVGR